MIDQSLQPAIFTAVIGALVALFVYRSGRKQARIAIVMDLHKEFYSAEFAAVRDRADRFVMYNYQQDWSKKPTKFDDPENNRDSMHQLVRFFYRASVLESTGQADRRLLYALFAYEIGYWAGYLLLRMKDRSEWSTKMEVLRLVQQAEIGERRNRFLAGRADGLHRATKGDVLVKGQNGELSRLSREVAEIFG